MYKLSYTFIDIFIKLSKYILIRFIMVHVDLDKACLLGLYIYSKECLLFKGLNSETGFGQTYTLCKVRHTSLYGAREGGGVVR